LYSIPAHLDLLQMLLITVVAVGFLILGFVIRGRQKSKSP